MSAAKKKQLFGGSDSDDDVATGGAFAEAAEDSFKVNRAYASEYDKVKRKQELQKLSSKYGDVEDSDDTEEDDDAKMLTAEAEADFAVLLKKLRSNDPSLKDKNVAFFRQQGGSDGESDDDDDRPTLPSGSKKAFTLKDEFQRGVVEAAAAAEEDEGPKGRRGRKAVTADEKAARAAFLAVAEGADESAAEFAIKDGTKGMAEKAKKSKAAAAMSDVEAEAAITEALGTTGSAEDAFLGKFFGAAGWKMEKEPEYTWEQEAADEQDEQFYDDAEQWEKEFQEKRFRHEEGDAAAQLQAFPRQQEGLLRQKDTARKEARERRAERQVTEESRAVEDLKRLKNLKRDEIKAFQRKIAEVAGLGRREERNRKAKKAAKKAGKKGGADADADDEDLEKPNFDDEDDAEEARIAKLLSQAALEEEYDPETFDKQMSALFDDNYYQDVDDDELGVMAAEDDFAVGADANEESAYFLANKEEMADAAAKDGSDDDDDEKPDASALAKRAAAAKKALEKRTAINAELPEELRGVDDELLYPTMQFEKAMRDGGASSSAAAGGEDTAEDAAELKRQLDKKVEEYWALHHSGVSGGLKTRFKYREVNPEKFGLDLEEIFTMDDRALNMIAPLAACATYNTRSQNTKDRYRALHRRKVLRMLPADRQSRRYKGTTVVFDPETIDGETGKKIARTVRRQVEGNDGEVDKEIDDADAEEVAKKAAVGAAKHTKNQARQVKRGDGPRDGKPQRQGHQQQQGQGNQQRRNPHHQHQGQSQNRPEGGKRTFDKRPRPQGEGNNNARRPPRAEGDVKATAATLDSL